MARPIRETPVLSGKDARRFEEAMQEIEKNAPKSSGKQTAISCVRNMSKYVRSGI